MGALAAVLTAPDGALLPPGAVAEAFAAPALTPAVRRELRGFIGAGVAPGGGRGGPQWLIGGSLAPVELAVVRALHVYEVYAPAPQLVPSAPVTGAVPTAAAPPPPLQTPGRPGPVSPPARLAAAAAAVTPPPPPPLSAGPPTVFVPLTEDVVLGPESAGGDLLSRCTGPGVRFLVHCGPREREAACALGVRALDELSFAEAHLLGCLPALEPGVRDAAVLAVLARCARARACVCACVCEYVCNATRNGTPAPLVPVESDCGCRWPLL